MDMASAKSDVYGPTKKVCHILIFFKVTTAPEKSLKKLIDTNWIELNLGLNKFYSGYGHVKTHLNLKSFLLTPDFSVWLSVNTH